jgi:putative hemolysin
MIIDLIADTQYAFLRLPEYLKLRNVSLITPHCSMSFVSGHYEVKTASTIDELRQVLKLRFDVFYREFSGRRIRFPFLPYDIDSFDLKCDHLIVKDTREDKVIAAYRLLHSAVAGDEFYSQGEFSFDPLLSIEGGKLELGRACVHKDYRHGTVMGLLWRGLLKYSRSTGARYLFGCSSIQRKDFGAYHKILDSLGKRNALLEKSSVLPKRLFQLDQYPEVQNELKDRDGEGSMNSLMHMYVLAGATMGAEGAYDEDMDCLDLFTWIDLTNLPASFERRFA